jgi:WD40 repeat protein
MIRGKPILLGGDPKGENILYTTGNSVVMRSLNNPLICDTYNEHGYPPTVARYSPSGFYIASGDSTGVIRIWDTTQAEHLLKIELRPLSGPISDISWSDDSKRIIAVGDGKEKYGAVFLWDSGSSVGEITGHSKAVTSCDFKKTRPYRVVTGGEDFLVNWFEGPPFKFKHSIKEHTRFVNCVRFNDQGTVFVSVSSDKRGIIYDAKTGEKKLEFSAEGAHQGGIYAASFNSEGTRILTASGDKTAKIWDVETGKAISTFTFGNEIEDQQLGCLWQKDHLVSVSLAGDMNFLDINNPSKPKQIIKGHNKFITAIAANPSKGKVYTGAYDAQIVAWDIQTGTTQAFEGKGHTNQINELHLAGNNLVSASMDDSVRVTPVDSLTYGPGQRFGTEGPANSVATNSSASVIVAGSNSHLTLIVGQKPAGTVPTAFGAKAVALSPDDKEVAVGGGDNHVYLYSLSGTTLTQTKKLEGHRGPISAAAYSKDGKYLATADTNREIIVWDTATKAVKVQGWVFHTARVNSIAWSPDNVHLASGSLDQSVFIWNVDNPTARIQIKNANHLGVNTVTWIDNNTVASAGQDSCWKTFALKY